MLKSIDESTRRILTGVLVFLVLGTALFGLGVFVAAQNPTQIYLVNPLTGQHTFVLYTNLTSVGYRFNATVWVNEAVDAASWQVGVIYNSTILNATRAWVPASDPAYIFHGMGRFTPPPSFQLGIVKIGDITLPPTGVTFTSPKILGIIEFEILLAPPEEGKLSSILSINNSDTYVLDLNDVEIQQSKVDGYFEYNWVAPSSQLEVKPSEYITRKLETFGVEVWLNKVEVSQRLIGVQFWLHYNATLLNIVNVTEGSFLSQFKNSPTAPYTTFIYVVEDQTVKVMILILPNSTLQGGEWTVFPQGNGTLANITFEGISQGPYPQENSCALELTNIIPLSDSLKDIKMLPPINGFYKILSRMPSTVSLKLSSNSVEYGVSVAINGDINPDKEAVNVTVYSRFGTADWTHAGVVKTNATGGFMHIYIPAKTGSYEFKANWTGDDTTLPSESLAYKLTVNRATSEISINMDRESVVLGSDVTIDGAITPYRGGANVTISYRLAGDQWSELAKVQTDSNGQYTFVWTTSQTGRFEIKADWSGDENTLQAESDIKSVNVEGQSNVFLYVIVAVIAIIAAALVLYYWRTRKSRQNISET